MSLQKASHDLARAGLGKIGGEDDVVGPGDGADLLHDVLFQVVDQRRHRPYSLFEGHEGGDRLPFDVVRLPTTAASATPG